jgi:hypothetical protein
MPSHITLTSGLALALLLSACAEQPSYGPESPYYAYSPAWRANLERPIAIPPGEATVRLQYGHPVPRNGVQETDPHCILEVETVAEGARNMAPAAFPVTRVQRREQTFSGMPVLPWRGLGGGFGSGGPSHLYYITEFRLRDEGQPQARALTCQHNVANAAIPRHLTLAEIRQALGDYIRLEAPR